MYKVFQLEVKKTAIFAKENRRPNNAGSPAQARIGFGTQWLSLIQQTCY